MSEKNKNIAFELIDQKIVAHIRAHERGSIRLAEDPLNAKALPYSFWFAP